MHKLFVHYRIDEPFGKRSDRAVTSCLLLDDEYKVLAKGVTIRSYINAYNDKRGKQIAYGRALCGLKINNGEMKFKDKWKVKREEACITLCYCGLANAGIRIYNIDKAFESKVFDKDTLILHSKEQHVLDRFIEKQKKNGVTNGQYVI